jgi:hypothetical protein
MAIDKSGKWWWGDGPQDLRDYLVAYSEDNCLATEFRLAMCACGSLVFSSEIDAHEGVARRKCVGCGIEHFLCDSQEVWDDASPKPWKCGTRCKSREANICIGFALRDDHQDIRWVYLGMRCTKCGVLGCYAEWKIDYSPSLHLLDLA